MQWPLGWLSDRADRRYVIAGLAAGTSLVSLLILWASAQGASLLILWSFAAWGGMALCIYSVCVAHACDIVDPGQIVSTVGTLLFSWATGVTIGPLLGAAAMEVMGPPGLFIYATLASLGLAAFITVRIIRVQRTPAKGGFADIAPSSSASAGLTPRAELDPDPDQGLAEATGQKDVSAATRVETSP
jgi:MFS family permease